MFPSFRLPLRVAPKATLMLPPTFATSGRVLVVDDLEINRRVLSRQLTSWRVEHDCVSGAAEALTALRTAASALRRRELDIAVVGAVEFGGDVRAQFADLPADSPLRANDAAIAFVLKRRSDAERDGNPILAQIDAADM